VPSTEVPWTAIWTALVIPVMAAIAAYIAYQNMRAAKHKIKIDLFEKRHAIMRRLEAAIESTLRSSDFGEEETPNNYLTYVEIAKEAQWLFDKKLMDWMHDYVENGIQRYIEAEDRLNQASSMDEMNVLREDVRECQKHLELAQHYLHTEFASYLTLYKQ
jgi:hypothetical protein